MDAAAMLEEQEVLRARQMADKKRLLELSRELNEAERAAAKSLPRIYTITATVTEGKERALGGPMIEGEVVRFNLRATEETKEAFRAHIRKFGSGPSLDEHVGSVGYYRFEGVLCATSAGHHIVPVPMKVNDKLWARLKEGDIPENILSVHYGGSRPYGSI